MLKTKKEIKAWLDAHGIIKYTINDDDLNDELTVDVNGHVDLSDKGLEFIPVQFNKVMMTFDCSNNKLTSLKGCPRFVKGYFTCKDNLLTSLEFSPSTVRGHFDCSKNLLTTLKGSPTRVGGDFKCLSNKLTSLKYAPKEVGYRIYGNFDCTSNKITSLEYSPKEIFGEGKEAFFKSGSFISDNFTHEEYLQFWKAKDLAEKLEKGLSKKVEKPHQARPIKI